VEARHARVVHEHSLAQNGVQPVVVGLAQLIVKHTVTHGLVRPSEEVFSEVIASLIEGSVLVACVPCVLMGVNQPVCKSQYCVFEGDPLFSLWVEVERHVVIPLNSHELVV